MSNSPLIFDLEISRNGSNYRAYVLGSPGGTGSTVISPPFTDAELTDLIAKMGFSASNQTPLTPRERAKTVKEFGNKLFRFFFSADIVRCWTASLIAAGQKQSSLEIRLVSNAPTSWHVSGPREWFVDI